MSMLTNKAYFSDVTVINISGSFTHKMAATTSWHRYNVERNYVTVTLLHGRRSGRPGGCPTNNLTNRSFYVQIISTFVNVK